MVEGIGGKGTGIYVVEPAASIAVGNDLDGGVVAALDAQARWDDLFDPRVSIACSRKRLHRMSTHYIPQAKLADALLLEGRLKNNVEVRSRVISQAEQNLHNGLVVLHGELNRTANKRPWDPIGANSVLTAAGEGAEFVFVEAAGLGRVEGEMGRDEREEKQKGGYDGFHGGDSCLDSSCVETSCFRSKAFFS